MQSDFVLLQKCTDMIEYGYTVIRQFPKFYAASDAEASNLHYANLAERTDTGPTPEVPPEQALVWAAERIEQIAVLTEEFLQLKGFV